MNLQRWGLPLLIISGALLAWATTALQVTVILRTPLTFAYVLIGTGMGWIRVLNIARGVAEWTLAIALSLAVTTVLAVIMLYTNQWAPEQSLLPLLVLIGIVGALLAGWYNPQPRTKTP